MPILYKSLPANRKPYGFKYKKGVWHKIEGELKICQNGFHASKNIIDAMSYIDCMWIAKVQVKGECIKECDKECWSEIKILEWYKWSKEDSVSLAIFAAELVLHNYEKEYPEDKRPREAINAAKKVFKKDTKENRSAARSAKTAAWSAARSAKAAARSAARSAEAAAWSAETAAMSAETAAWSAEAAAWSAKAAANLKKCHNFVLSRKFKK